MQAEIDSAQRVPTPVITMNMHYGAADTVVIVPGMEIVPFETRYRGRRAIMPTDILFGQRLFTAPWDSVVAVAHGEGGYLLERRHVNGFLLGRVSVAGPRRVVTDAMVEDEIARGLARMSGPASEGMVDPEESRRQVREQPVADSLPPYAGLIPGHDGMLWVLDFLTWLDSATTLTAFRGDGAITARLTFPRLAQPVWFGPDRVMLREVDADGVVRFGVYRIIPHLGGS